MATRNMRKPRRLVRRFLSERYLLLMMLSFALSVSFTRLFLEITGYPQLGNSELHFAHVLWGGLVWFAGSLLPLVFANHRTLDISAVLTGVGVGLFIDEVGKFITQTNDYFYPAAAPIIYSFFLVTLFIFTLIRKKVNLTPRERLFHVLEQFEEVLEGDLSDIERDRILRELALVSRQQTDAQLQRLAAFFTTILEDQNQQVVVHQPDVFDKLDARWNRIKAGVFYKKAPPRWLFSIWLVFGIISVLHPAISLLAARTQLALPKFWNAFIQVRLEPLYGIGLVERLRLAGEAVVGGFMVVAAVMAFFGAKKLAVRVAYVSLLAGIVLVNPLVFFFDQFSAIIFTFFHFSVFFFTRQYRLILESNS